jgi:hypothetical protein
VFEESKYIRLRGESLVFASHLPRNYSGLSDGRSQSIATKCDTQNSPYRFCRERSFNPTFDPALLRQTLPNGK